MSSDHLKRHRDVTRADPHPRLRLAVHAAHRPAGARAARLLRDPPLHDVGRGDRGACAPSGIILSGGPASVYDAERADAATRALLRAGRARARHLLRHAAHGRALLGGEVDARPRARVRPGRRRASDRAARSSPASRGAQHPGLDEPRRPGRPRCPTGFEPLGSTPSTARSPPSRDRERGSSTACSSTPRSRTRRAAARSCATSCSDVCRLRRRAGRMASFVDDGDRGDPRRGRRRERVICGLSGGVDSVGGRGASCHRAIGDQLTCIFVDNGLLRAGRGRAGRRRLFRDTLRLHARASSTPRERFLERAAPA